MDVPKMEALETEIALPAVEGLSLADANSASEKVDKQVDDTKLGAAEPATLSAPPAADQKAKVEAPKSEPGTATAETQTVMKFTVKPPSVYNPDFAAHLNDSRAEKEELMTNMAEDIDKGQRSDYTGGMCVACDKPGVKLCGGCEVAVYCSPECQKKDWGRIHKPVCNAFKEMTEANRPSPEHRRVLYFPAKSDKHELVWALYKEEGGRRWVEFEHPDLHEFYKQARKSQMQIAAGRGIENLNFSSTLGGRPIGHMLCAMHFSLAKTNDKLLATKHMNRSINALTKEPGHIHPWLGPIAIFVDGRKVGEKVVKFLDVTPRDVHTTVRFFKAHDCICAPDADHYPGKVIESLKINDLKTDLNTAMGIKKTFEMVPAPLVPQKCHDQVVAMAFHLGLRWYIRYGYTTSNINGTVWNDGNLRYLSCVAQIDEIYLDPAEKDATTKKATGYGAKWVYGDFKDSVALLHGSGNQVDMHHVLAFNGYLDEVFVNKGVASQEGFKKFWSKYKIDGGGPVSSVPSPYKWEKNGVVDCIGVYRPDFVGLIIESRIDGLWKYILTNLSSIRARDTKRPGSKNK